MSQKFIKFLYDKSLSVFAKYYVYESSFDVVSHNNKSYKNNYLYTRAASRICRRFLRRTCSLRIELFTKPFSVHFQITEIYLMYFKKYYSD